MRENKTEKYTFGPYEKETLEILSSFESEFEQTQIQKQNQSLNQNKNPNQDKNKLQLVKYYESFKISKSEISGIFLAEQKDTEGNISYHLYFQSPSNEILSVDHEGNIKINPQWEPVIGYIDFEKCMYINDSQQGRLKGISEKAEPEEIQERLQNKKASKQEEQDEQKEDAQKKEQEASQQKEEKEQDEEEEKPEDQIEKDLSGENQEDLGISYYRQIKDANFEEQIGMNLKGYQEIGLAYSKTKNAFIFVGKKDGHYQQVEGFEPAEPTYKTVMSIDEKGESVEKKVPHAIMETSNPEKELSITIGQYGYIEVGTIDRLPCNERVKRQVGEQGEGEKGRTDAQLNRTIKEQGIAGLHKWAHENDQKHEQMEQGEQRKGDITQEISKGNDEYIPGTNVKWRDFANECGYRGEDGIEYAKEIFEQEKQKNPDKTNAELAEEIPEEKLEDTPYGERKH